MRVAIVGTGGLGCLYGALFLRGGWDVHFVARRQATVDALRDHGLRVAFLKQAEIGLPASGHIDPAEIGPVDLILFCTKTYDLDDAARRAVPLIGPETLAIPVQNGVMAPSILARHLGERPVLGGTSYAGGTLVSPGRIVQKGNRTTLIYGEADGGRSERTDRLQASFATIDGLDARLAGDVRVALWEKFVQAGAFSATDSLFRWPTCSYVDVPSLGRLMRETMNEIAALGRARGVPLPADVVDRRWTDFTKIARAMPHIHASMYHDIMAGHRLEIEETIGDAVRMGVELGVAMPRATFLYEALKPFANGSPYPSPKESA